MIIPLLITLLLSQTTDATASKSVQTTMLSPTEIMKMSPFKRSAWCKNINIPQDLSQIEKILFAPMAHSKIEIVRNYLEMKRHKLPSATGYFSPPRVKISKTEIREGKNKKGTILYTLLGTPIFTNDKKTQLMGDFIKRGCILFKVFKRKGNLIPDFLHKAAFTQPTMLFRHEIVQALQSMGGVIVLHFLPWSKKRYNKDRNRKGFMMARFATYILNSSMSGNPRLALQNSPLELKLKLINLYSEYRVATAINPLLTLSKSDDKIVRNAAREAIKDYFRGRAKKTRVGTIKLPGGMEKTGILYLSARQQAYHAIKRALEKATQGDYDRTSSTIQLTLQLFKAWDKIKDAKWDHVFEDGYDKYKNGFIHEAVGKYKQVMANISNIKQNQLMIPAFVILIRKALMEKNMNEALKLGRLLIQLHPTKKLSADIYYLLGLSEEAKGDKSLALHWYKIALKNDPSHQWTIAAVKSIEPIPMKPVEEWEWSMLLAAFLFAFLLAITYAVFPGNSRNAN
jgi:tetratricopeptide (TPR) repeat protein